MEWLKKNWYWLILAAVVLIAIYFAMKAPSVTAGTTLIDTNNDGKGDLAFNPRPYTDALYSTIYSKAPWFTLSAYRDTKPYQDLLALTNAQVVAVAQDWNERYYKQDSQTLLQAIADETLSADIINPITARFRALNIS